MPGLVPNVIIGSSVLASIVISRSYVAPSSVGSVFQRATAASKSAPFGANGAAGNVLICFIVRRDQPGPRAAFDRHIADRHPLFHRERANGRAANTRSRIPSPPPMPIFESSFRIMSFAVTPGFQRPVDAHGKRLRRPLQQALRRQHVLHFAGADAERQRSERSMRRRVAVTANHRHARLRQSLLRPHHVDDALLLALKSVTADPELAAIRLQLRHLRGGDLIENRQARAVWSASSDPSWRWSDRAGGP